MRLGKCMLAPQGCIFMNVNPQSMANSTDTISLIYRETEMGTR